MVEKFAKPVILLAFANDRDNTIGYLRNLPDEARQLRDILEAAEQSGLCEVEVRTDCTAGDIFKVFQDPRFRTRIAIFHFAGHANGYQMLLQSAQGQSAAADAGGFAAFLGQQQGLKLVFLNGCSTQLQSEALLNANIPTVIATSCAIDDQVATEFSRRFYQGLAGGASVRIAFNQAAAAVQTVRGGQTRDLYFGVQDATQVQLATDRWPWNLYLREGSETADQWSLPEAVDDPLSVLRPLPLSDLPESPYRHLNWFTRKDAEIFFGRSHQILELYHRLTASSTAPIVLFYGQSGVGKSSVLDAGLIPRLEQDYEVRYLRRGAGGLLATLRFAFFPEVDDVPIETAWRLREEQLKKPLIVFLDQVEELYTRPLTDMPDEVAQTMKVMQAIFGDPQRRPQGKLVLGFRKEWLAELESQLIAFELPRTRVFLEALDRRGVIEVVRGPTRTKRLQEQFGLTIEDGLAEIIADDLLADRGSAIAPTLQILLTKLWGKATEADYEHPHFSQDLYQQLKRDGILLRDFFNQQIIEFRKEYPEAVDSGLLLDIIALHTTPLGTADQCSVELLLQQYAHLSAKLPDLLQHCQDLYLLTVTANGEKASTKTTRLAHDTLAPLVREQFDTSDKPGQRARRILGNRAIDWDQQRNGTPLDEADLTIVEQGTGGMRALNSNEQRLLEASRDLRNKLQRTRTTLKIAGVLAVLMIAVLAGIGWWNFTQASEARDKLKLANTQLSTKRAEAEASLVVATHSLTDLLDLYLELPKRASGIAAATAAKEARSEFEALEKDGVPASLRVTSPDIAKTVNQIENAIKVWELYAGALELSDYDHPSEACRQAVLKLVRVTRESLDAKSADGDLSVERRKLEHGIIAEKLCKRAADVTSNLAKADLTDKVAIASLRSEFERLYWAELYWLELEQNRPVDGISLETAMMKFRGEGLDNWGPDPKPKDELQKLADDVSDAGKRLLGSTHTK